MPKPLRPLVNSTDIAVVLGIVPDKAWQPNHEDLVNQGMELCRWQCTPPEWRHYLNGLILYWRAVEKRAGALSTVADELTSLESYVSSPPPKVRLTATGMIHGHLVRLWRADTHRLSSVAFLAGSPARIFLRFKKRWLWFWIRGQRVELLLPEGMDKDGSEIARELAWKVLRKRPKLA
jgi:hypothetical protein